MVNTFYPLYSTFFTQLGFDPVMPDVPSKKGMDQKEAAFCYPAELSHGFFYSLLYMDDPPDFIFLPHFKAVPAQKGYSSSQVCPFVQGETFFLRTTFKQKLDELKNRGIKVLTPMLDLTAGLETARKPLIETALKMGVGKKEAKQAFEKACKHRQNVWLK